MTIVTLLRMTSCPPLSSSDSPSKTTTSSTPSTMTSATSTPMARMPMRTTCTTELAMKRTTTMSIAPMPSTTSETTTTTTTTTMTSFHRANKLRRTQNMNMNMNISPSSSSFNSSSGSMRRTATTTTAISTHKRRRKRNFNHATRNQLSDSTILITTMLVVTFAMIMIIVGMHCQEVESAPLTSSSLSTSFPLFTTRGSLLGRNLNVFDPTTISDGNENEKSTYNDANQVDTVNTEKNIKDMNRNNIFSNNNNDNDINTNIPKTTRIIGGNPLPSSSNIPSNNPNNQNSNDPNTITNDNNDNNDNDGNNIINGSSSSSNSYHDSSSFSHEKTFPYMSSLQWTTHRCGGTLIAPDILLTAAHCALATWEDVHSAGDAFSGSVGDVAYDGYREYNSKLLRGDDGTSGSSGNGSKSSIGGGWFPDEEYGDGWLPALHTAVLGATDLIATTSSSSTSGSESSMDTEYIIIPSDEINNAINSKNIDGDNSTSTTTASATTTTTTTTTKPTNIFQKETLVVEKTILHPDYNPNGDGPPQPDVAIVKLYGKSRFITKFAKLNMDWMVPPDPSNIVSVPMVSSDSTILTKNGEDEGDSSNSTEITTATTVPTIDLITSTANSVFNSESSMESPSSSESFSSSSTTSSTSLLTAIGYGSTTIEGGPPSNVLMETSLTYIPNPQCLTKGLWNLLDDDMMCAFGDGERDSCSGDSGGPLFYHHRGSGGGGGGGGGSSSGDSDGEETDDDGIVQVGIVSWGVGCADDKIPGVYTRVSHYYEWIRTQVCALSNDPPSSYFCPPKFSSTSLAASSTPLVVQFQLPLFATNYGLLVESLDDGTAILDYPPGSYEGERGTMEYTLEVKAGGRYRIVLLNTSGTTLFGGRIIVAWGQEKLVDESASQGSLLVYAIERKFVIGGKEVTNGTIESSTLEVPSTSPTVVSSTSPSDVPTTPSPDTSSSSIVVDSTDLEAAEVSETAPVESMNELTSVTRPQPSPTSAPFASPSTLPTKLPTSKPTKLPTAVPTNAPTPEPFSAGGSSTMVIPSNASSRGNVSLDGGKTYTIDTYYVRTILGYDEDFIPMEVSISGRSFVFIRSGVEISPQVGNAISITEGSYLLTNGGKMIGGTAHSNENGTHNAGHGLWLDASNADIMSGTIVGGNSDDTDLFGGTAVYATGKSALNIRGGRFSGGRNKADGSLDGSSLVVENDSLVHVYGGKFLDGWKVAFGGSVVIHGCSFELQDGSLQAKLLDGNDLNVLFVGDESKVTASLVVGCPDEPPESDEEEFSDYTPNDNNNARPDPSSSNNSSNGGNPSSPPTNRPTSKPTYQPTQSPTKIPTVVPTSHPSNSPTANPITSHPSMASSSPSVAPSATPSSKRSSQPSVIPSSGSEKPTAAMSQMAQMAPQASDSTTAPTSTTVSKRPTSSLSDPYREQISDAMRDPIGTEAQPDNEQQPDAEPPIPDSLGTEQQTKPAMEAPQGVLMLNTSKFEQIDTNYAESKLGYPGGVVSSSVIITNNAYIFIDMAVFPGASETGSTAMEVKGNSYLMTNKNTVITGGEVLGDAIDTECHGLVFDEGSTGDLMTGTVISGGRRDSLESNACAATVARGGSSVDIWGGKYNGGPNLEDTDKFGYSLIAESKSKINVYGGDFVSGWFIGPSSMIMIHGCEMSYTDGGVKATLRDRSSIDVPVEYGEVLGGLSRGSLQFQEDCPAVEDVDAEPQNLIENDSDSSISTAPTQSSIFNIESPASGDIAPAESPPAISSEDYTDVLGPNTTNNIRMTLHGINALSDTMTWERVTALFINNFYSEIGKRAFEVNAKIEFKQQFPTVSTTSGGVVVQVVYSQTTAYRAQSSDVTVDEIILGPFLAEEGRAKYVQVIKETLVGVDSLIFASMPDLLAESPDASTSFTKGNGSKSTNNAGIIAGSLIGIFLAIILCCGSAFFMLWRRKQREEKNMSNPDEEECEEGDDDGNRSRIITICCAPAFCVAHHIVERKSRKQSDQDENEMIGEDEVNTTQNNESKPQRKKLIFASLQPRFDRMAEGIKERRKTVKERNKGGEDVSNRPAEDAALDAAEDGSAIPAYQPFSQYSEHIGNPDGANVERHASGSAILSHQSVSTSTVSLGKEVLDLEIPPGTLGLILDSQDSGWPVVHDVKASSIATGFIKNGDRLVSIEGKDVRTIKSVEMPSIMNKPCDHSRTITIFRGDNN